jgi:hypothetical protein
MMHQQVASRLRTDQLPAFRSTWTDSSSRSCRVPLLPRCDLPVSLCDTAR